MTGTIHYVDNGMHAMGLSLDSSNFKEYIDKQVPSRVGHKLHAHIPCPPLRNLILLKQKPEQAPEDSGSIALGTLPPTSLQREKGNHTDTLWLLAVG